MAWERWVGVEFAPKSAWFGQILYSWFGHKSFFVLQTIHITLHIPLSTIWAIGRRIPKPNQRRPNRKDGSGCPKFRSLRLDRLQEEILERFGTQGYPFLHDDVIILSSHEDGITRVDTGRFGKWTRSDGGKLEGFRSSGGDHRWRLGL